MSAHPVTASAAGLYGKLPARGDFVQRDLPATFVSAWDGWLAAALTASRQQLAERWLPCYLNSPVWRFALSAGCCGPAPVAGLLMPSVDRVGRYFPLTLAATLASPADLSALPGTAADWFEQAEQLLLEALADEIDLEEFYTRVQGLGVPACSPLNTAPAFGERWCLPLSGLEGLPETLGGLLPVLLDRVFPRPTLWWSHGSHQIGPCVLISAGLPAAADFSALLAGDWQRYGWTVLAPLPARPADLT